MKQISYSSRIPRFVAETINRGGSGASADLDAYSYYQFIFKTPSGLPSQEPAPQAITLIEDEEIWKLVPIVETWKLKGGGSGLTSPPQQGRQMKKLSEKQWTTSKRNLIWYDFCKSAGIPASGQVRLKFVISSRHFQIIHFLTRAWHLKIFCCV